RDRVLAQVHALGDAEAAAVPAILADLAGNAEVLPRLRAMWQDDDPQQQRRRMRAGLALLPVEPESVRDVLVRHLLRLDEPAEAAGRDANRIILGSWGSKGRAEGAVPCPDCTGGVRCRRRTLGETCRPGRGANAQGQSTPSGHVGAGPAARA